MANKELPTMVVQSKVKEYLSGMGLRSTGELVPAVNEALGVILKSAAERCKANGRSTVRASDL